LEQGCGDQLSFASLRLEAIAFFLPQSASLNAEPRVWLSVFDT
jgi:hypothetical protein